MRNSAFFRFLTKNKLVFVCAESCTGGWLARKTTSVSGSSQVFWGGVVVYSNEAKQAFLGVKSEILEKDGAVSGPCALAMAEGLAKVSKAGLNLSVTGVAGPGGGSPEKPVGTVWFGLAGAFPSLAVQMRFPGNRRSVQRQAVRFGRHILTRWWLQRGELDSQRDMTDNERNCLISFFPSTSQTSFTIDKQSN